MAIETMFEKLKLTDQKNILIQGLPSSIEKQFLKLNFAKSVTPLLSSRKIDFALVFAVNKKQLSNILNDVIPALASNANFWIAYPKITSKIASDLTRDSSWQCLDSHKLEALFQVDLDTVWTAMNFCKMHISRNVNGKTTAVTKLGSKPKHVIVERELLTA